MYARIGFEAGWISWNTSVINTGFLATAPMPQKLAAPHQARATTLLGRAYAAFAGPGDPAQVQAEKMRVFGALGQIVPWLSADHLQSPEWFDFSIHCAIAHHRLPEDQRQQREQRIAGIVDGLLADAPEWAERCGEGWAPHKTLGILLPDVFLDTHLRTMAARLVSASCAAALPGKLRNPMSPLLKLLPLPGPQTRPSEGAFFEIMANLYITRSPAERPAVLELIGEAKRLKQVDWVIRANQLLLDAQAANVSGVIHGDALIAILRDTLALPDEKTRQQAVRFQLDRLVELQKARTQQVVQLTIDAVLAGVPLGDTYTAQLRAALAAEQQATDGARRSADEDPVHAWSVDRLAAWIEGPVTRQPIDRQRIRARERQLASDRTQRQAAAVPRIEPEPELADGDIDLAVDEALRATAAFFRDDLGDMLALARQLGVGAAPIQQAMQQREAMARLASSTDSVGDEQSHALLAAAEAAAVQLRTNIQQSKTSLRQRMAFTQALNAALQQEGLAMGKRQGGVIACPMPLESWPWVFDTFHGAWLHQKHRLEVNHMQLPLRSDQALALYVTGSSQSGHAFDISVHLWQRRPGAIGLPGVESGGGLRMNTDDWFDTYTPCAVLHVPIGR